MTLLLIVIGTLIFGVGMSMTLIEDWNMMNQGIVTGIIGLIILFIVILLRRKLSGKKRGNLNWKTIGCFAYLLFSCIVFGFGLAIVTCYQKYMIFGMIFGVTGIVLLICFIRMIKGFKE